MDAERRMYEAVGQGMAVPMYLVYEDSAAMTAALGPLDECVAALRAEIARDPLLADIVSLGLITFSSSAQVAFRRVHTWEDPPPYELRPGRPSRWGPAFRALASVVPEDARLLRADGYSVHRPLAFFLVSSPPQDPNWSQVFRETLTYDRETGKGMRQYPIFFPVSAGDGPYDEMLYSLAYPQGRGHRARARGAADVYRVVFESFRLLIND